MFWIRIFSFDELLIFYFLEFFLDFIWLLVKGIDKLEVFFILFGLCILFKWWLLLLDRLDKILILCYFLAKVSFSFLMLVFFIMVARRVVMYWARRILIKRRLEFILIEKSGTYGFIRLYRFLVLLG